MLVISIVEAFDLTYLSASWRMELAPCIVRDCTNKQVVKASSGHYPQPFLIRDAVKNWCKDNSENEIAKRKSWMGGFRCSPYKITCATISLPYTWVMGGIWIGAGAGFV